MKRVIKFRAYTEISNEVLGMKYDVPHNYNDTVMQFTGLLDRNGKEIYEGDLVANTDSELYYSSHSYLTYRVFWSDKTWQLGWRLKSINGDETPDFTFEDILDPKETEIIGNIYENLELLK